MTCIIATVSLDKNGYSRPTVKGKRVFAHRMVLAGKLGRPIAKGMLALHTCDNPSCVNPNHLYEGTHADNTRDKMNRGRWKGNEKLYPQEIAAIRLLLEVRSGAQIAKMFGVSEGTVSEIHTGKVHK